MKPTKSILCHRSNSGSSPRLPPLTHPRVVSPFLSPGVLLHQRFSVPFVARHPSFHPRHALEAKLLWLRFHGLLPQRVPYHRAGFSLIRQYNLPDAYEVWVTREKRVFRTCTINCVRFVYHFQLRPNGKYQPQ